MQRFAFIAALMLIGASVHAAEEPAQGDFSMKDFQFASGEKLPELRIHYRTFGVLKRDAKGRATNAVLILHGTGGAGTQFLRADFAGQLFGSGEPLSTARYFIILPDNIGHGQSSKPSDGPHAKFPHYGYRDMIVSQYRLLTEHLQVDHLTLVMGTSMGGMHTWLWGEMHPDFMDALLPLASLPTQISGRNRAWRRIAIDAIRKDPEWNNGDYSSQNGQSQPGGLRVAEQMLWLMGNNPLVRQQQMQTLAASDTAFDAAIDDSLKGADANDLLYQLESSYDYDPGPDLEKIRAPLTAINFADDLINPPELGILEREIKRVPKGRAIVMPLTSDTRGHGTHTLAAVWKRYLMELMAVAGRS
jgi:homoserine O-acetyltransferase